MKQHVNEELEIALADCIRACNACAVACIQEKDVRMLGDCIRLSMDCAEVCQSTLSFSARQSSHLDQLIIVCASICTACAIECEKHAVHMEHCKECAEACRKCEELCLEYTR